MKKLVAWLLNKKYRTLKVAVGFWAMAHALDIVSTAMSLGIVPGAFESNVFATDPETMAFSLGRVVFIKLAFGLLTIVFPAVFLYVATEREDLASLPLWYNGVHALPATMQNLGILYLYLSYSR